MARTPDPSAPAAPDGQVGRHRQIDGLRALAMVGVLYVHTFEGSATTENLRVSLFFVLSGFLITHILLTAKERGGRLHIGNFYLRRALRLFPALAVLVLIGVIFDIDGFRASALWHLGQMSNIWFLQTGVYRPWVVGHLWSLNLLEQFYLVWPLVILLLPLKRIYLATLALIVGMAFLRVNAEAMGLDWFWANLVFGFAPIGFGALACLLQRVPAVREAVTSRGALALSLAVFASPLYLWEGFGKSESYYFLCLPALAAVVIGAFQGYRGPVGWVLASAPARFLSQISYGVYIYHLPVWWAVSLVDESIFAHELRTFVVISGLTLIVATLSWYLLEEPISRLKRFFPTATPAATTTSTPAAEPAASRFSA
ncbi:MAG: acyltransferase [Fuscovulum sp.]|nr:acyltransferase [Fuscovulum sp.]